MRSFNLHLVEDDAAAGAPLIEPHLDLPRLEPQIFVRQFSVPAGFPWDQFRAADLEARHGAPLPSSEVIYRLRRVDRWRPGAQARYVAFYLRASELVAPVETTHVVNGQSVFVRFLSPAEQTKRMKRAALYAGAGAAVVILVGTAAATTLAVRALLDEQADLVNASAGSTLAALTSANDVRRENAALAAAGVLSRSLDVYLKDLAWASAAKTPAARVDAVHWESGYMALEVHGEGVPFTRFDRPVRRSDKVLAHGARLWLVGPAEDAAP